MDAELAVRLSLAKFAMMEPEKLIESTISVVYESNEEILIINEKVIEMVKKKVVRGARIIIRSKYDLMPEMNKICYYNLADEYEDEVLEEILEQIK